MQNYLKNPNLIALLIALLTTAFLRLQLFPGLPGSDGGFYTFTCQWMFNAVTQDIVIKDSTLLLYPFITSWVYALDVNQYLQLRLIDGAVAVAVSVVFFKVILKESGSNLFTIIFMVPMLIIMNDVQYIGFGFRNSIWAAYLPLFTALLVWQNSTKDDKYSFYLIGGLVSLGVLLREPFLPFSVLAGIAIYIGFSSHALFKYIIGAAVLGFSVLIFMLMFRGWDLQNLINSYTSHLLNYPDFGAAAISQRLMSGIFLFVQKSWFICVLALFSITYLIQLHFFNKKSVGINRSYFWILLVLIPIIRPILGISYEYHYALCLPGLAGLSAMGWKYLSLHQSKQTKKLSILLIGMMGLLVIVPIVNSTIIKSKQIYLPSDVMKWTNNPNAFRGSNTIERNQYSRMAATIYEYSKEDSTLAVSGMMQVLYPLTELLPPTFEFSNLRILHLKNNEDDERLIKIIMKYRPTLIVTTGWTAGERVLSEVIGKIDIYEEVGNIPLNPNINYGWKSGIIYRLKDFN